MSPLEDEQILIWPELAMALCVLLCAQKDHGFGTIAWTD